jgi:hypothetical protein
MFAARCPSEISCLSKVSSKPDQAFRDRELNCRLRFVAGADVFIEDQAGYPALFLFETMKGLGFYFSTRSLASDCPIELNTDRVWFGSVTRKNLSVPLAQYCRTEEVGSPPVLTCTV